MRLDPLYVGLYLPGERLFLTANLGYRARQFGVPELLR